jgi:hypothetical protein
MIDFKSILVNPPRGGLYLHLIQPKRRISEPGKTISPNMSVVKPGKFNGSLNGRMRTYRSSSYWTFDDSGEPAFEDSATISYLILNGENIPPEFRWLITGLEHRLIELIQERFNVIQKIGRGKSEYREIEFTSIEDYNNTVRQISDEINRLVEKIIS